MFAKNPYVYTIGLRIYCSTDVGAKSSSSRGSTGSSCNGRTEIEHNDNIMLNICTYLFCIFLPISRNYIFLLMKFYFFPPSISLLH